MMLVGQENHHVSARLLIFRAMGSLIFEQALMLDPLKIFLEKKLKKKVMTSNISIFGLHRGQPTISILG